MSYYELYCLPPEFSKRDDLAAIKKECYLAAKVQYIDGKTAEIINIDYANNDDILDKIKPGNHLWLEGMKYITRVWNEKKWDPIREIPYHKVLLRPAII